MNKKYINPKTGKKYHYFDRQGKGTDDCLEWAKMFEDKIKDGSDYRIVKQEYTWMRFWVSTVWIGLDHPFWENQPPLIFETMVFSRNKSDLDMERYTTEKQAINGHRKMVKKWSNPFYVIYKVLDNKTWRLQWEVEKLIKKLKRDKKKEEKK